MRADVGIGLPDRSGRVACGLARPRRRNRDGRPPAPPAGHRARRSSRNSTHRPRDGNGCRSSRPRARPRRKSSDCASRWTCSRNRSKSCRRWRPSWPTRSRRRRRRRRRWRPGPSRRPGATRPWHGRRRPARVGGRRRDAPARAAVDAARAIHPAPHQRVAAGHLRHASPPVRQVRGPAEQLPAPGLLAALLPAAQRAVAAGGRTRSSAPPGVELESASSTGSLHDNFTLVAGRFYSPLGFFNERLHTTWIFKTPDRPLMFSQVSRRRCRSTASGQGGSAGLGGPGR